MIILFISVIIWPIIGIIGMGWAYLMCTYYMKFAYRIKLRSSIDIVTSMLLGPITLILCIVLLIEYKQFNKLFKCKNKN